MKLLILCVLVIASLLLLPILGLWSVSVVFDVSVSYDFKHWLAMLALILIFAGSARN